MNKLFAVFLAVVMALTASFDVEARRLGGGKSLGRQSSNVTQREAARAPVQAPTQQAGRTAGANTPATPARKPWGAMLGGLAAGLGLAALAHALGFGEGFANLLLILLLVMAAVAVFRFLQRRGPAAANGPGMAYQGAPAAGGYNPRNVGNDAAARPWESQGTAFTSSGVAGGSIIGSGLSGSQTWGVPADFDTEGFVSAAKRNFVTLQQAWDRADIPALRAMMTDGLLSEIQAQLAEREQSAGGQPNLTEVVKIDAQLLGIEELPDEYMASVEFNGLIREEPGAGPTPFREVWNMTKRKQGGGWLVAGVQALQ